jgi:hypothetical protein
VKEIEAGMELRVQGVMAEAEVRWKATEAAIEARGEAVTAGVRAVTAARVAVQRAWEVQQLHNQEKRTREAERRAQRAQQEEKRAREAERQLKEEQHLRKQVQQELREEQQLRKEEGQQLLVQLRRKERELKDSEAVLNELASSADVRRPGRPRHRVLMIRKLIQQEALQNSASGICTERAPSYWKSLLEAQKILVQDLHSAAEKDAVKMAELEKQARLAPKQLMKRKAMELVNKLEKHTRAYKNMKYGVEVQQHFIDLASLGNVPPRSLEPLVRCFYRFHFPQVLSLCY